MRLLVYALVLLAACGPEMSDTAIALNIGPAGLSGAKTLTAHAVLNGQPSNKIFRIISGPLNRLGVRLDAAQRGLLHLDVTAEDSADCVIWRGALDVEIPARAEMAVSLLAVPPECK